MQSNEMTYEEALNNIKQVNERTKELVNLLLEIRDRKGWKALGFSSWTACLSSDLFSYSRKQLHEFIRAAPVTERLHDAGITVNHSVANVLASFSPETQVIAAKTALKRHGKLTESNARRTAEVIEQAEKTGHVEGVPGGTNALEAALDLADKEARNRQNAYRQGDLIFGTVYTHHVGLGVVTFKVTDTALMTALRNAPPGTPASISLQRYEPTEDARQSVRYERRVDTRLVSKVG